MSLQPRKIGETQAQYNRRVGTKRPQTVGRPQKVERVSVMPTDMKSKDVAIPNQEVRIKRKPQQTGVGVAIPEKKTDRGRPVTKIGNRTIYEADMRKAKANQQILAETQISKNVPKDLAEQLKKLQQQQLQQQQPVNPRTGKPFTPQQLEKIRANQERFAKEQATKLPLLQKFMKGEIGRKELRGTFTPREIRNIEKGRLARQFLDGKLTDRQLSRSGRFSVRELRDIKRNARYNRMSPEERRAFGERQLKERQRLTKMAEDRRTQPQRRRRRVRDAYRRLTADARSRVGRRRRPTPTRGTGVRVARRGRRGLV